MTENTSHHTDSTVRTNPTATPTDHAENGIRKFRRRRSNRMVAGVCSGGAELLGVDAALLRILLIVATLLGFGLGIVLYIACWIVVPEE